MSVFAVLFRQEIVELVHQWQRIGVLGGDQFSDALGEPGGEFPYLHVVVEEDETDVAETLEGGGCVGSGEEFGVGLDDVEGDVLPDLHVDLLDVEVLQGVVYQVEVPLQTRSLPQHPPDYLHQQLVALLLHH